MNPVLTGRAVLGVCPRSFFFWDYEFGTRRRMDVFSCGCCELSLRGSVSGQSLLRRSPTACGASVCHREVSTEWRHWLTRDCRDMRDGSWQLPRRNDKQVSSN